MVDRGEGPVSRFAAEELIIIAVKPPSSPGAEKARYDWRGEARRCAIHVCCV